MFVINKHSAILEYLGAKSTIKLQILVSAIHLSKYRYIRIKIKIIKGKRNKLKGK
jgi:hypothetical protein